MTAAKPEKPADETRDSVIDAAMHLAATQRWEDVRLSDIAAQAGLTLAGLRAVFESKSAIIEGLMARIDKSVLDGDDPEMAGEPARDRLFDVLMRRMEALKPYRGALKSITRAYRRDPFAAARFNTRARVSMKWMLEAAGIDAAGRMGHMRAQGLVLVMARVLPVFLRDRDAGLAPTMAALDRALRDGEQAMRALSSGLRMAGMFAAFVSGVRERARADFDEDGFGDREDLYGDDDTPAGEPWTGGPH